MELTGLGTAVMVAVAALLWFAYLIPTWTRRREYLATERNATRLQQTIRIMAESAEAPEEVRLEAKARDVAHQARLLREQDRQRVAREEAELAAVRRREDPQIVRARQGRSRLRRVRLISAGGLLAGLVVAAIQGVALLAAPVTAGGIIVLAVAAIVAVSSAGTLRTLARRRVAAPRLAAETTAPTRQQLRDFAMEQSGQAAPAPGWTPVPLPRPLYIDAPQRQTAEPGIDAQRRMRAAAAEAERRLRDAHAQPGVVAFPAPRTAETASPTAEPRRRAEGSTSSPAPTAPPSRWSSMGVVGDVAGSGLDLDEVLRRRRTG
ncbi:hypothetical protein [Schumannella sp. 10F1B-5-1]|uniref:hypothetical protein n=1 Tax=Schumannella sp. 10F1B-5-1 TaxID=2590780 RepID=UPI0011325180|nr:hypothetical protein [Schumannella sp. 10F1B-5-1]TPW72922.1 hypothetical protein FJ658_06600 [Schumannella sp. 10F1B-5-1]